MTMTRNKSGWRLKLTITLWLMAMASCAWAQCNITPLATSPVYLKTQLWALSVSNTGASIEARLQMDMKDLNSHESVLTAATGIFLVPRGATIVSVNNLQPIVYNYNSPVFVDRTPNGALPVGQYEVCYQLILAGAETQALLAEDCDEIAVEPMSPPLLTSPEDDSVVTVAQPNFTWTPPAPASMFSDLSYDVIITEVNDGQSVTDAIERNLPLQQAQGLRQPFLGYPLTGPQLDPNKTYAWQVVARNQQTFATKSEVWSFRTPGSKGILAFNSSRYILMDGRPTGVGYADSAMLWLKYVSSGTVYPAQLVVKDLSGSVLLTTTCKIRQGDNWLNIPLNGNFEKKRKYIAVLTDQGGKETTVTFTIK